MKVQNTISTPLMIIVSLSSIAYLLAHCDVSLARETGDLL